MKPKPAKFIKIEDNDEGFIEDNDPDFGYRKAGIESTLLCAIAQCWLIGKTWDDQLVQSCYNKLRLLSSRQIARGVYTGSEGSQSLRKWALSLIKK
jgi:hypothetical protein